ncbi:hypothetical protein D3C73_1005200 [compost metagenome]
MSTPHPKRTSVDDPLPSHGYRQRAPLMKRPDLERIFALALFGASTLSVSGCFIGPDDEWATRAQVVEAAERCGLLQFQPQPVGNAWAAHVPESISEHKIKEDCIYEQLAQRRLLATR